MAVIRFEITGDAPPMLRGQVSAALQKRFSKHGIELIGRGRVIAQLRRDPNLVDCTSRSCLQQIGKKLRTTAFLKVRLEASGPSYRLELTMVTESGQRERVRRGECDVCTLSELSELIGSRCDQLIANPAVKVTILSEPAGAEIFIGNQARGYAPLEADLEPGTYKVRASRAGYADVEQTVRLVAGGEQTQRVRLRMVRSVARSAPEISRPYRTWKWMAGVGAIVGFGLGTTLLVLDGNCTSDPVAPALECPSVIETTMGGVISVASGVVLAGATWFMFRTDRRHRARVSVGTAGQSAKAVLTFDF